MDVKQVAPGWIDWPRDAWSQVDCALAGGATKRKAVITEVAEEIDPMGHAAPGERSQDPNRGGDETED